jgi:hypothetical protein
MNAETGGTKTDPPRPARGVTSTRFRNILRGSRVLAGLLATVAATAVTVAIFRPNRAYAPGPLPDLETWPAVADGLHNSNTDLIHWRETFWLAHAAAPWHFASASTRIVLRRSDDARSWKEVASFSVPGEDVRDPKLAVWGDRLLLYFLPNRHFPEPQPYTTMVTASSDGLSWGKPQPVEPRGWLLWRPKALGSDLMVTAYWNGHGRAILLRSSDGLSFQIVSDIVTGESGDETDFEILDDGRILSTSRLEGANHDAWLGDPGGSTLLSVASPPYTAWRGVHDNKARLDGPCLFRWKGRVYALGRYEPESGGFMFRMGSILSRKRTALYLVEPTGLRVLGILPSAGDTSYAGVALHEGSLYASYYTSRVDRDPPWIIGMLSPSEIRIARLPLSVLEALADRR